MVTPKRRALAALAVAVAGAIGLGAQIRVLPVGAVRAQAATAAPGCSWSGERDVNVGAPDLDAFYYATGVTVQSGTQVVITGRYPTARYFSFTRRMRT